MPRILTSIINTRLLAREKAEVVEAARSAGLTVSAYARRRLLGHPVIASGDRQVINELRRLGGLLLHLDTRAGGPVSQETRELRQRLAAAVERLARGTS